MIKENTDLNHVLQSPNPGRDLFLNPIGSLRIDQKAYPEVDREVKVCQEADQFLILVWRDIVPNQRVLIPPKSLIQDLIVGIIRIIRIILLRWIIKQFLK